MGVKIGDDSIARDTIQQSTTNSLSRKVSNDHAREFETKVCEEAEQIGLKT